MGAFLSNRAKEADRKEMQRHDAASRGDIDTVRRLEAELADLAPWQAGGTYRQIVTALVGAVSGNVGGSTTALLQSAAANYLQSLGAQQLKELAPFVGGEGSPAHTALHALAGCVGAVASNQSCGAAAFGAGASVVINELLRESGGVSAEEREARRNLATTIIAGIAGATGSTNVSTVLNAAAIEAENNSVYLNRDRVHKFKAEATKELEQKCAGAAMLEHCYQTGFRVLDRQATLLDVAIQLSKQPKMTEAQAMRFGQIGLELVMLGGTPESVYQLITGKSSITQEETNRFIAAITLVPGSKTILRSVDVAIDAARGARAAESAAAQLPNLTTRVFTETEVLRLGGENRGLIFVAETPVGNQAAKDFQAATTGAFGDLALKREAVPALRYDNPNGFNFIKFDGVEAAADGTTVLLIDAKTKLAIWSPGAQTTVAATSDRVAAALAQNPGYKSFMNFLIRALLPPRENLLSIVALKTSYPFESGRRE